MRQEADDTFAQKLGEQAYMVKMDHDKAIIALEQAWQAKASAREQELQANFNATQQALKSKHEEVLETERTRWLDQHNKALATALLQSQQEKERMLEEQTAAHAVVLQAMEAQHKVLPISYYLTSPILTTSSHPNLRH